MVGVNKMNIFIAVNSCIFYYCHITIAIITIIINIIIITIIIVLLLHTSAVKNSNSSRNRETYYAVHYADRRTKKKHCYFSNFWRHHPPRIQSWRHLR